MGLVALGLVRRGSQFYETFLNNVAEAVAKTAFKEWRAVIYSITRRVTGTDGAKI